MIVCIQYRLSFAIVFSDDFNVFIIFVHYCIFYRVWFGLVDRNLAIKRTGNTTLRVQAPFVGVTKNWRSRQDCGSLFTTTP